MQALEECSQLGSEVSEYTLSLSNVAATAVHMV